MSEITNKSKSEVLGLKVADIMPQELTWRDSTRAGAKTVYRRKSARTPLGDYFSTYEGDGDFCAGGPTLDYSLRCNSVEHGIKLINQHYADLMAAHRGAS